MSVRVNVTQTSELQREGAYLANVVNGELHLYPQGLGEGPLIVMSKDDWTRIRREVMLAFARSEGRSAELLAADAIAREGNYQEDE